MLQAQGHSSIQRACAADAHGEFDAKLCNADFDLSGLAKGLELSSTGRLCLYGPPGTGKTAFGHWLSEELDKPLILKRMSDLQSPWLGEMRSEEHTSELQSLMRSSYAVFCLKQNKHTK